MTSWRAEQLKRRKERQDISSFKEYINGDASVEFQLPANAFLAVRKSGGFAGGDVLQAGSRTLGSPALVGDRVHQLGWIEKGVRVKALNGVSLLLKDGFKWVEVGAWEPAPPTPGPLDFSTGDTGLTEFRQEFDLALPQVAVGIGFFYTGTPTFTVTYGGETLQAYARLNGVTGIDGVGIGSLIAVGRELTVENAELVISCTDGTFGGMFGRISEINYDYLSNWNDSAGGTNSSSPRLEGSPGELFAVGITAAYMTTPAFLTPLQRTTWGRIQDADGNDATISLGRGKQSQVQLLNNGFRAYALQAVSIKEKPEDDEEEE